MRFLHHFRYRTADLERRSKTALSTVSRGQITWTSPMKNAELCACFIGFMSAAPAFAQAAGGTQSIGPKGSGDFVPGTSKNSPK
jgi:hypothetical protein